MPTIQAILEPIFRKAIFEAFAIDADPLIGLSQNEKFGDYQSNAAMGLAKVLSEKTGQKTNPRAVAEQIKSKLNLAEIASEISIAGPGFINVRLSPAWLEKRLEGISGDARLGIELVERSETIVVDYSGPNIAKEMHVGHLRSTIIGDAISRVLEFQGHKIIRQNHIGDWGTQFGKVVLAIWYLSTDNTDGHSQLLTLAAKMLQSKKDNAREELLACLQKLHLRHQEAINADPTGDKAFSAFLNNYNLENLEQLMLVYQMVSLFDEIPEADTMEFEISRVGDKPRTMASIPRYVTVMLQSGSRTDLQELDAWRKVREATLKSCDVLYRRMGIRLTHLDERGESFYNPMLSEVVEDLLNRGIAERSEGAVVVKVPGYESPLIIQKSDRAYLYGTTDLAAIRFRKRALHANRIIYTHDSRQQQHFTQVFWTADKAGWISKDNLVYAPFGTMLGEDGKPFKTRTGGTVKLKDLLDEAEERALVVVSGKNSELPIEQRRDIAHKIGIGAVKYADLAKDRISDYAFSFDKILALDGNTAPYLQYAHARIKSIFRKTEEKPGTIRLESPYELSMAKHILRLGEVIEQVAREFKPHHLCGYLYELATQFSRFYENCPVLQSEPEVRRSRLAICDLAARTLECGLDLLGIEHPDQM